MAIVDVRVAQGDILIILSYLETIGFGYLPQYRIDNLKAYLMQFGKAYRNQQPIVLDPGEAQPFGALWLSNRGTKKLVVKMSVVER